MGSCGEELPHRGLMIGQLEEQQVTSRFVSDGSSVKAADAGELTALIERA